MDIVLATGNPHKVEELAAIFADLGLVGVRLRSLQEAAGGRPLHEPHETGTTFEQNATIKALSYAQQTGMLCLADDSGIEIDALDGRPGVISSHYCTDGQERGMSRAERDHANNARVMREMENVPVEKRTARFVCVMALASPTPASGTGLQPVTTPSTSLSPITYEHVSIHTRNLPHWQSGGATYFVTFNLARGEMSGPERALVLSACKHWDGARLDLLCCVVMPDHAHLILRPRLVSETAYHPLPDLIHGIKRHSARAINSLRGSEGSVWQDEYFDRIIRPDEWDDTWNYVVRNPVEARLVAEPEDYEFLFINRELYRALPKAVVEAERIAAGKAVEESSHGLQTRATSPGSPLCLVRGTFEGRIGLPTQVPRGENGFGYDPLFLVAPEFTFTGAEMPPKQKNKRSHRARAAELMANRLRSMPTMSF